MTKNLSEKMALVSDFLVAYHLTDVPFQSCYVARHSAMLRLDVQDKAVTPEMRRRIKKAFGKFSNRFEPPYVELFAKVILSENFSVECILDNAFVCEITATTIEKVEVPAQEATVTERAKHTYSCKPAKGIGF